MGIGMFRSSSMSRIDAYEAAKANKYKDFPVTGSYTNNIPAPPNPNPSNYKIIGKHEDWGHLVIIIQYLDCTNYEGRKILVFKNCTYLQLVAQRLIDPHFSENKKYHHPIARFEPTEEGWKYAVDFLKQINNT